MFDSSEELDVKHDALVACPLVHDSYEIVELIVHTNELVPSRRHLKQQMRRRVVITSMLIIVQKKVLQNSMQAEMIPRPINCCKKRQDQRNCLPTVAHGSNIKAIAYQLVQIVATYCPLGGDPCK